ncbi:MAG: DUF1016 N-terminal domain-containing protein [Candidatus Eremiobacterota bacterium]
MIINQSLYDDIRTIIEQARSKVVQSVNRVMVITYWEIGRRIVEEEQHGEKRAEYGKYLIKDLSEKLTQEFGKGFNERELRRMRQFYNQFPIRDSVRPELSWTHYRLLLRVEDETTRNFYLNECAESSWSSRQLERQINSFYYQRLLASQDKELVKTEAESNNQIIKPADLLKNPYILEFLDLKENTAYLQVSHRSSEVSP